MERLTAGPGAGEPDAEALREELAAAHAALARAVAAADLREAALRHELDHRVRNMLAIVRSIFTRTAAAGSSLEDVADHFQGRLDTISRFQLMQPGDPGGTADFEQILRNELQSFSFGYTPGLAIDGPAVCVPNAAAHALALAFHELVTNSIKFGVLGVQRAQGEIVARWSVTDDVLHFVWDERGVPVVTSAPMRRGFGREFIEEGLPYQIGARTSFALQGGGVRCEIAVPLPTGRSPPSENAPTFEEST